MNFIDPGYWTCVKPGFCKFSDLYERILATNPANFSFAYYYSPNRTIEDSEDYNVLYMGIVLGKYLLNRWRICHYLPGLQIIHSTSR